MDYCHRCGELLDENKDNLALTIRDFVHKSNNDGTGNDVVSTMAFIPRFKTSGWPQAALNGLEVGGFFIDVYKSCQPDASSITRGGTSVNSPGIVAACSKPGAKPWTGINWLNARIAASNRLINGRRCHLITPFERFSILSLIMATGKWGQFDAIIYKLIPDFYEWEDCRIESGFIHPKAYLAGATAASAAYIDYDDNAGGDGANIHQLTPGVYTITDATYGNEDVIVERVIITGRFTGRLILSSPTSMQHLDNSLIRLKTAIDLSNGVSAGWAVIGALLDDAAGKYMALPNKADTTTHASTYLDQWYKYDNSDSRALARCGHWVLTTKARSGLLVGTDSEPTSTNTNIGFRAALSIGNL